MTFYEAALQVLEREGKPLHFKAITERAVQEKLLSHVGKDPDAVMYSRLAAMSRRKGDRRVVATEAGTFGLLDWGVQEDPTALEAQVIPVPDENEVPYRPRERHPAPLRQMERPAGKGDRWRKDRDDREDRGGKRRLPPLPELVFEALTQAKAPMSAVDLASLLREGDKVAQDLGAETVLSALREDNRRRQSHDRRPLFLISDSGEITVDRAGSPGTAAPVDLQAAFASALGVPLEGDRRPESGRSDTRPERLGPGAQRIVQQAREHQKTIGRLLRRRYSDLETGAAELVTIALLEAHGFRDVRASKRSKEGAILTARRKDGLMDTRFAVRLLRGSREVSRQDIVDLRTDVTAYNAQVGMVVSAGEVSRDGRSEAIAGTCLILLWAGEALAEKLIEKKIGATTVTVEIGDLDESYFRAAKEQGDTEDRRREERRLEREQREEQERAERVVRGATPVSGPPPEIGPAAENPPAAVAEAPTRTEPAASAPPEMSASVATVESAPAPAAVESAPPSSTIEVRVDLSGPAPVPSGPTAEAMAAELAKGEGESPAEAVTPPKGT